MRLSVDHVTHYRFEPPMRGVIQSLRLTPSVFDGQIAIDWSIDTGDAVRGATFRDGAGDWIETAKHVGPTEESFVAVRGLVETVDLTGVLRGHREIMSPAVYLRSTRATRPDIALTELAQAAVAKIAPDRGLDRAHALMNAVADAVAYSPGETEHGTTAAEALAMGHGVCQDHTHVLIAAARLLDMPARYVTGYLFASEDETAQEASHAWAEIFVPDLGWVGFDTSNRICPNDHYIRIGSGRDAADAAPIRGVARGFGEESLDVKVVVNLAAQ